MAKIMIAAYDGSQPGRCVNADVLDAIGIDASLPMTDLQETEAIALAFDVACSLYGAENADAYIIK